MHRGSDLRLRVVAVGVYGCEVGVVWGFGFSIRGVGGLTIRTPR